MTDPDLPAGADPAPSKAVQRITRAESRLLRTVVGLVGLALVVAIAGTLGFSWLIGHTWPWNLPEKTPRVVDAVKLAFAVVAGVGGVVALVVAYRRQRILELDEAGHRDLTRLLTERFGAAAQQLGSDAAAVRLAGVYAMAAVADEWEEQRQQCIDVLCAYLRLPYTGDPAPDAPTTIVREHPWPDGASTGRETLSYTSRAGESEVRNTIIRVISDHLTGQAPVSWSPYDFDFAGAHFGPASFIQATFGGHANFERMTFHEIALFSGATFRQPAWFNEAKFGAAAWFAKTTFHDMAWFRGAVFGDDAWFGSATFHDTALFGDATFHGTARFEAVMFHQAAMVDGTTFKGRALFGGATFHGTSWFNGTTFQDTAVFDEATFQADKLTFEEATFEAAAQFGGATFEGEANFTKTDFLGKADFTGVVFTQPPHGLDRSS